MMGQQSMNEKLQILHFQSQDVHFCMDLGFIKKVLPLVSFEAIPGAANYVAGLINIAGRSITVIDFGLCIGLSRQRPYTLDTPILICGNEKQEFGMIIDKVIDLVTIEKKSLQMKEQFDKTDSPFIATVVLENRLALLVNMNEILSIDLVTAQPRFAIDKELANKMRIEL